jgi:hypothetical protein
LAFNEHHPPWAAMPGGKTAMALEARRRITTGSVFGDPWRSAGAVSGPDASAKNITFRNL